MKLGVPHYNRENTSMNPSTQMNQSNGTNFFPQQAQQTTQLAEAGSENTADSVCDEAIMQAKQAFVNHGIYGPQSMSPTDTRTGGFEASYNPVNEDLQITVRGKTRFMNGLVIGANGIVSALESDLATLARVLNYIGDEVLTNTIVSNYYSWSEEQKENARLNFADRIAEMVWIWQDEPWLMFRIDEPCWDDITAMLNMNIDVQSEGVAAYSTATNTGNDHLQVTLVKNPERSEFREVRNLIQTTAERVGRERSESIDTAADLTTGARVDSTRFGSGRNTNPYDSELTLSNLHLQNTPGELNDFNRSMLRRTIYFDHDQSELDANDKARIDQFIVDFREADNETQNSTVRLEGHASRAGSTAYNRRLVNARLASVMGYLREKGFPNIEARVATENRSDEMAEEYPDTGSNAAEFRSVRIIVGSGELQNTVAHEFGHVFGLLDEYATVGTSFSGTGTAPGTEVGHSDMSENIGAGRVLSENSDNIMSAGNTVRAQHYGPFGWALHQLTNKNWEVF